MKFIQIVLIIVIAIFPTYFLAVPFGGLYERIVNDPGSYVDVRFFSGLPLAYTFFLTLLFTAFGRGKKYWWLAILLIPAAVFELYFDAAHIYLPIALGVAGFLLGLLVRRFFPVRAS